MQQNADARNHGAPLPKRRRYAGPAPNEGNRDVRHASEISAFGQKHESHE
jgi:hypothetical protein